MKIGDYVQVVPDDRYPSPKGWGTITKLDLGRVIFNVIEVELDGGWHATFPAEWVREMVILEEEPL